MLFQCEGKGIVGFLCILIRTDGITIVLIHIVANQCNFLYDAEVACFDGVAAIGVSIHIVEERRKSAVAPVYHRRREADR